MKKNKLEKYRNRVHMLLLYPDDLTHMAALDKIKTSYDYAAILHDRDVWTEEDEKLNPDHKSGTLKKAHYHVILRFSNAKWNTAIASDLGIKENYIEEIRNINNSLLYLIHYNEPNKTQYDPSEVFGVLKDKVKELINMNGKGESEKVTELIEYIISQTEPITITEFAYYCSVNGYWSEFRRSGAIFCKIIEEHNFKIENKKIRH